MKKKVGILIMSLLLIVSNIGMVLAVNAEQVLLTDAEWTTVSSTNNYQSTDGYTEISNLAGWGARSYYNYKVKLDGLEINLKTTSNTGDCIGICLGNSIYSYFGESSTPVTISMWKNLYAGQTRLHIGSSHDYNGDPLVYTATDGLTKGFGVATSMVINDAATIGYKLKFTKENDDYYRVTFTMTDSSMWDTNANYDANGGGEGIPTCHVFMPVSAIASALDANGELYVIIAGMPSGSNAAVSAFTKIIDSNSIDYEANTLLDADTAKTAYASAIENISDEATFNTAILARNTLETAIESLRENDKAVYISELVVLDSLIKENSSAQTIINGIVQNDIDLFATANTVLATEENINDENITATNTAKNTALASLNAKMDMLTDDNILVLQANFDAQEYKLNYAKSLKWILDYEYMVNALEIDSATIGEEIATVKDFKNAYINSTEEILKNSLNQTDIDVLNARIIANDNALSQAEADADIAVKTAYITAFETSMKEDLTIISNINFAYSKYAQVTENVTITEDDGELYTRLTVGYQTLKQACEDYYITEMDAVNTLLDSVYLNYTSFEPVRTKYKAIKYTDYINDTYDEYQNIVNQYNALTTRIQANIWYYIGQTDLSNIKQNESGIYFEMIGRHPNRINYNKALDLNTGINVSIELTQMAYYNGDKTENGNSKGANNICINFLSEANAYKSMSSGITIVIWLFESESSVQIVNSNDVAIATAVLSTPINGGSLSITAKYQDYYDFVSDSTYKAYVFNIGGNQLVITPDQFETGGINIPENKEVFFSLGSYSDYKEDANIFTLKSINDVNFGLTKLSTPEISLNENVVSWTAVSNATGYIVTVNGIESNVISDTTYTITDTAVGDYIISVVAVGEDLYINSNSSNTLTYTITDTKRIGCKSSTNELGLLAILGLGIIFAIKKTKIKN
jgi:hypothetical protein